VRTFLCCVVAALFTVAGCKESIFGPPTESVCPDVQTLTYENFGKGFVEDYCTECHSSTVTGADREGAPLHHDFDTVLGIRQVHEHVDEVAAAGPAAVNDAMPEDDPKPTLEERYQLGEWIACGMPTDEDLAEIAVARLLGQRPSSAARSYASRALRQRSVLPQP
jgi:hypothetical protein